MLSMVNDLFSVNDDNFIGAFLYGSQNYGLATEDSDIDVIAIVNTAKKPSKELKMPNGKVKIYTIEHFLSRLRHGDLECYEALCTKYRDVNQSYETLFDGFAKELFTCLNYDIIRRSLAKKLDEHLSHVLWILRRNDPSRYNKKRLYWAIRVYNQLQRISNGENFETSLVYKPYNEYDLTKIKSITNYLTQKELSQIIKEMTTYKNTLPVYTKTITTAEERCMVSFYDNITKLGVDCEQ